jgi:hypothetical protein
MTNGAGATERQADWTVRSVVQDWYNDRTLSRRKQAYLLQEWKRFCGARSIDEVSPGLLEDGELSWTKALLATKHPSRLVETIRKPEELIFLASRVLDVFDDSLHLDDASVEMDRLRDPEAYAAEEARAKAERERIIAEYEQQQAAAGVAS